MNTESDKKNELLAGISLILGILSLGLFILASLSLIWIRLAHFGEYQAISYVYWALLILLGSLILGIPGCIVAIIGLARIRKQGGDNKTLRTAILGLVLGGIGPAFILFYVAFGLLFNPSTPAPVLITPSSIIP